MNRLVEFTRNCFIAVALAAGPLLMTGCSSEPPKAKRWEIKAIPDDELEALYTMAAKAAVDQLPARDCIDPKLAPSSLAKFEPIDADGWTTAPDSVRFRVLADARVATVPEEAQRILGKAKFKSGCERRLVFTKAEVIEFESKQGLKIEAVIGIDYLCPLCSHGSIANFVKRNGRWEIEPKLKGTFVS